MNWFALLILVPLGLIGLSGPFATTILGCIAISQIRRSNGKIHGLGLAVFDALFYPLLALAGIILMLVRLVAPPFMQGRIVVLPLAAAVFAWLAIVIVRRVWRAASRGIDGAHGEGSRPRSDAKWVITLLAVVMLTMVFVIGLALLSWRSSRSSAPTDAYSLADHPEELRQRSVTEVIQAGIAKPLAPWAWQELDRRHLTPDDGDRILSGLTAWVRSDYPDGFATQPLNWLDTFLDDPKHLNLFPEERKLDFAQAVYGNPQCQSLYRFREGRPTLEWQCRLRNPFIQSLLGFGLLNEVRAITIDGQPVVPSSNMAQGNPLDFATTLRLPALAPGRHILKAEVLSALAPTEDVSSLTTGSPSSAWPPTKRRWTRTAQSELMVYARDAEIVSQTQDPALDPSALISVKRVVIRPAGANFQAVVELEIGDKLPVPVSFDGSLRLGGSTVQCSGSVLSDGASSQATGLAAQIPALDPGIKETEITLLPDPHAVEEQPGINRIWGKPIVFKHVPLTRWDQQQSSGAPAKGTSPSAEAVQVLCAAARDGELAKVNELLKENPSLVSGMDDEEKTPLHWAAEFGHKDVAEALIAAGVGLQPHDKLGDTPLHLAAEFGFLDMTEFLTDKGAAVNGRNNNGMTPLHWAVMKDRVEIVKFLLAQKADVNAPDGAGLTPLHYAARGGHADVMKLLIAAGANANAAADSTRQTPLYEAVVAGHVDAVQLLLDAGADVLARDKYGDTPLHWAVLGHEKELVAVVKMLLDAKADVNALNNDHKTPLAFLVQNNGDAKDVAQLLRDHGGRE